jgi:protein SCO1
METRRRETGALLALVAIVLITVGWWVAALWPLPATTPEWVARARAACFGSTGSGLPNAGGWIMLVGTPLTMVAALLLMAGAELRGGCARVLRSRVASAAAALLLLGVAGGLGAAVVRVADARAGYAAELAAGPVDVRLQRTSHPAPAMELLDQSGERLPLERFRGAPVLVTFAFGKCETVCPVIVQQAREARLLLGAEAPPLLVVTLDPWRDTPARLPHVAAMWGLEPGEHVLSGPVQEVERALDDWGVQRARDPRTGDVAHASVLMVVDADGRVAFTLGGRADQVVEAVRELSS